MSLLNFALFAAKNANTSSYDDTNDNCNEEDHLLCIVSWLRNIFDGSAFFCKVGFWAHALCCKLIERDFCVIETLTRNASRWLKVRKNV
jgi:hypothetical protein